MPTGPAARKGISQMLIYICNKWRFIDAKTLSSSTQYSVHVFYNKQNKTGEEYSNIWKTAHLTMYGRHFADKQKLICLQQL